jgi:outer membrane immunogenic protein
MKKILLATSAIVAAVVAAPAGAADLRAPIMKAPPIVRPACAQFGGWYLGGHAGWTYYKNEWKDRDNYGFNFTGADHIGDGTENDNGWHGGLQGGYNWQTGCTVFGVQVDWSWNSSSVDSFFVDNPRFAGTGTFAYSSDLKWFGTARARTGVVVDNLLLYVTGGLAWAKFDRNLVYTVGAGAGLTGEAFSSDKTRIGFALGVGTEWSWGNNWSLVSELLYMGFEKDGQNYNCTRAATCGGAAFVGTPFRYEHQDSVWVTRIGLNYRFGGGYPVVANY